MNLCFPESGLWNTKINCPAPDAGAFKNNRFTEIRSNAPSILPSAQEFPKQVLEDVTPVASTLHLYQ